MESRNKKLKNSSLKTKSNLWNKNLGGMKNLVISKITLNIRYLVVLIFTIFWIKGVSQTPLNSPRIVSINNASTTFSNDGPYEISWENNEPDSRVDSFIIYRFKSWNATENKPQYEEVAKFKNTGGITFYRYVPEEEISKVVFYVVEVVPKDKINYKNSSSNLSLIPWVNAPSNVLLSGKEDTCNATFILSWNKYRGWGSISKYYFRIEYQEDNNTPKILYVKGSEYIVNDTTITIPNNQTTGFEFKNGSSYRFRVTAIDFSTGIFCNSNIVSYVAKIPKVTTYINADGSRVNSNESITLTFSVEPDNEYKKMIIERSLFDSRDFEPIDTIYMENNIVIYTDQVSELDKKHYYYKATLLNDCDVPVSGLESNINTNIILQITPPKQPENKCLLSWEFYRYFNGDVKEYVIHRIRKNNIESLGSTTDNKFLDDIAKLNDKQVAEDICYQVEAIEENNPYGVNGHVWSNTVCITIQANIEMPKYLLLGDNCKSPSQNPFRFPVGAFTPTKFYMAIFDRWGTKVFETEDPTEGWDGTNKGRVLSQGGYMYFIRFAGSDGIYKEQKGSFTVLCSER